jgi:hypothetical protein
MTIRGKKMGETQEPIQFYENENYTKALVFLFLHEKEQGANASSIPISLPREQQTYLMVDIINLLKTKHNMKVSIYCQGGELIIREALTL